MRLSVMSVAYPLAPVGPDAVGGAEQILTLLDAALVRAGHRSIVIACEQSQTYGELVATPRCKGALTDEVRNWAQQQHRIAIEETLNREHVDLIHMHSLDFSRLLPAKILPILATLHLPPDRYPPDVYNAMRPGLWLQCVSESEFRNCPQSQQLLPPIANGVDVERLTAHYRKRGYALALGRICPEKGFHHALDASRQARIPLLLGGEVFKYPDHLNYFRNEIEPRLDAQRRFIGPVGLRKKRRLLTQARCLLIPSLAAETSSLVAMEALACGTPVVAFPSGALPEIIEDGKTGFLVDDAKGMAAALERVSAIDPEVCRRTAAERFSASPMTANYLRRYEELVGNWRNCHKASNSRWSLNPSKI